MAKIEFHEPTGDIIQNISIEEMRKYIIDEFLTYWRRGSGDGYLDYYEKGLKKYTMMIGPNEQYGIYLQYIDNIKNEIYLSLQDADSLEEVAETADEIYASVGLFLPIGLAWEGIKDFILSGLKSEKIVWTTPEIIPEEGNY